MSIRHSGGMAMSAGAQYQSHVIADAYVYVVCQRQVPWFGLGARVPIAVWGESHGPGDDVRIEFAAGRGAEAQAKHSMGAGQEFTDLVDGIRSRSGDSTMPVALVVGSASGPLRQIGKDLDRLRAGREDGLRAELAVLLADPVRREVLERLFVIVADFDQPHSAARASAIDRLRARLVDPDRADAAWDVLVADAADLSANESRRDAAYLGLLLSARGFQLRPPLRDEPWWNRLQWIRESLLDARHDLVALENLQRLEGDLAGVDVSVEVRTECARLRTIALMRQERHSEAVGVARQMVALAPSWANGLAAASQAALGAGELALAGEYADRAIRADGDNERAWTAKALVVDRAGGTMPAVPTAVEQSTRYRGAMVDIARRGGDNTRILDLTAHLVTGPGAVPEHRFVRAQALQVAGGDASAVASREALLEAESLLTDVIESVHALHPLLAPAFLVRSQVRARLGRRADAEADLADAERSSLNDPEVIHQAAAMRAGQGDLEGALRILRTPATDDAPMLRAMRAEILVGIGDSAAAQRDIDATASSVVPGPEADLVFLQLAGAALRLGNDQLAEELGNRMTNSGQEAAPGLLLAGEIAFARGEIDRGIELHRSAVEVDGRRSAPILMRLGLELHAIGRHQEALAVFNEVGLDAFEAPALPAYARTAFAAGDLEAAQAAIERVSGQPLPAWALTLAAEIALRRDAPEEAARHLGELETRGEASARVRMALARCLVELGREAEALVQAHSALDAGPTARERVQAAVYLKELGKPAEALRQAFRAFREERGDPQIQRSFVSLLFTCGIELPKPEEVGDGTYVRLRREDGATREHVVFSDMPIDPLSQEMSVADADQAGLLRMRVGEAVERDAGHWTGHRWTVEEILPAMVFRARQIVDSFADNFPNEPFFVVQVPLKDDGGVIDWSKLIAALGEREERTKEVLRVYRDQMLPLELVASMLQVSVPDVMQAAGSELGGRSLPVEWSDASGQARSMQALSDSTSIVVTRSALHTARRLGLLEQIALHYQIVAPTSLVWQLRLEIREAEEAAARGRSTMTLAGHGPHIEDIAAGDPRLLEAVESAKLTLTWVEEHATQEPRPVSTVGDPSTTREETREQLGPPSYDAVVLAESAAGALYADDLGLRRAAFVTSTRPPSFSSISLIEDMTSRGVLAPVDRDRLIADLVLSGYDYVRPSLGVLEEALRRMPGIGVEGLDTAFSPLGGPMLTPLEAAALVVDAIKSAISAPIQVVSVQAVVSAGVRGMARRWNQGVAARLVRQRAERELALHPSAYLQTVVEACQALALESIPQI